MRWVTWSGAAVAVEEERFAAAARNSLEVRGSRKRNDTSQGRKPGGA